MPSRPTTSAALLGAFFLAATTQASAEPRIYSAGNMPGTKFIIPLSKSVTKVKTKVTVQPGTATIVAAYALVNSGTCVENGPGAWVVKKAPKNGTTTFGTETGPLTNGQCPGINFTFATISYTSTRANAKLDHMVADWSQKYAGVNYIVEDAFTIKIAK